MAGIIEKIKNHFKKKTEENMFADKIYKAKMELMDAENSFNEAIDSDYIDVAILNFNLAKKKYELCISEAKNYRRAS